MTRSPNATSGPLALIGGRFESDNEPLFKALKSLCDGRIAVLAMASGFPMEVGQELVEDFTHYGVSAELIPLFWENRDSAAFDQALIARLAACGSVFFSGGNQQRIVETLVQNDVETPALTCIRECHTRGGLVAGTSAGAAIMSGPMILSGTSLNALSSGAATDSNDTESFRLGRGLGFFSWGLVDQHFLQRGRVGRLLAASRELGQQLAFGVDENSALLVTGESATVIGETGVLVIDLRNARFDCDGYDFDRVLVSYLDDGDSFDLARGKSVTAPDKKPLRVSRASYRRPAPVRRPAFGSYTILDLLLRLVEGDPAHYRRDSALAYDEQSEVQLCLELERMPRRSRALRAIRQGEIRYSAVDFKLRVSSRRLSQEQNAALNNIVLPPDPVPQARLVLLGNSPLTWGRGNQLSLREELREPVGILATASGEAYKVAGAYREWLHELGMRSEIFDISRANIERASRDRRLLKKLGAMGSLIITGGDQRRLTEALLHCAEATPILHEIVSAYERGMPLVGVAAAASAFAQRMIVDGDSEAALRHGSSEDAGYAGVVVEPGIGLTSLGMIDQNFLERHRLGRLLVAAAASGARYAFGLCEESGLVISGGNTLRALGNTGVIIASLGRDAARPRPPYFQPDHIQLSYLAPGEIFNPDSETTRHPLDEQTGLALLARAVDDLAQDYNSSVVPGMTQLNGHTLLTELS